MKRRDKRKITIRRVYFLPPPLSYAKWTQQNFNTGKVIDLLQ